MLRILRVTPFYAPAYANLATCIEDSVDIITKNGTINFTKRQLYQQAIALTSSGLAEPLYGKCNRCYDNLGELLDSDDVEISLKKNTPYVHNCNNFVHIQLQPDHRYDYPDPLNNQNFPVH